MTDNLPDHGERPKLPYLEELKAVRLPPVVHVGRAIGRGQMCRGYVYAITDSEPGGAGPCRVYINWASATKMREVLLRLQVGNPAQLRVIAVLQREHRDDAKLICDMIFGGLMLRLIRGNWFEVESEQKMIASFGRIDRL